MGPIPHRLMAEWSAADGELPVIVGRWGAVCRRPHRTAAAVSIKGAAQKSGRDELAPMTPDFAQFLLQTPESHRHGPAFRLNRGRRHGSARSPPRWPDRRQDRQDGRGDRQPAGRQDGECPRPPADVRHPLGKESYAGRPTTADAARQRADDHAILRRPGGGRSNRRPMGQSPGHRLRSW